jgi:hypothetical protein
MIIYDITSTPDFGSDTTLENLITFAVEKEYFMTLVKWG